MSLAEEGEQVEVSQDLELLADFVADVGLGIWRAGKLEEVADENSC